MEAETILLIISISLFTITTITTILKNLYLVRKNIKKTDKLEKEMELLKQHIFKK